MEVDYFICEECLLGLVRPALATPHFCPMCHEEMVEVVDIDEMIYELEVARKNKKENPGGK